VCPALSLSANASDPSPDGRRVALDIMDPSTGNMDIWIYEASSGLATRLTTHQALDSAPVWSPDGRRIAFLLSAYVPSGLFYLAPDGTLMSIVVKGGETFDAEPARPLFKTRPRQHISSGDLFSYDVTADGQRFLVNTDVGEAGATSLHLIQSWPLMVRR
jgi:Tol biopolymer transport system component